LPDIAQIRALPPDLLANKHIAIAALSQMMRGHEGRLVGGLGRRNRA
jgi:hypothetical protein